MMYQKFLNTNRPNIISIKNDGLKYQEKDTNREIVVFYDKNEDKRYNIEYREFEYKQTFIIGDIIEHDNIRVVDISSLKYFRAFTRVEQYDLFSIYRHYIVVEVGYDIDGVKRGYFCCGNDSKYNNIGNMLNDNPSLREYYSSAEKLLIHLLTNYDISKRDTPLEIIPNETRKKYVIEGKKYYAYSEEEAIVTHESHK